MSNHFADYQVEECSHIIVASLSFHVQFTIASCKALLQNVLHLSKTFNAILHKPCTIKYAISMTEQS